MFGLTLILSAVPKELSRPSEVVPSPSFWYERPNSSFPASGEKPTVFMARIDRKDVFDELIACWNVERPVGAQVRVEIKANYPDRSTKWYTLADWAYDATKSSRVSVDHQKDEDGNVLTDTLRLKVPAKQFDLRVSMRTSDGAERGALKMVSLMFSHQGSLAADLPKKSSAWGKAIPVPVKAQRNYPNGGVICSPTSVSMLLNHWSTELGRTDLAIDVPEVVAGVWDTVYKGAGNWPFNMAYAGSFPGMTGYVSRLRDVQDLEAWTSVGVPVACSVSFDLLRGKPLSPTESGHLIVVVGFTETGDVVVNDPAFPEVRKTYPRADFVKSWDYSQRTVYLLYADSIKPPKRANAPWISPENRAK